MTDDRTVQEEGELQFDEIGYWSEIKLDILSEYARPYSTILSKRSRFHHVYIDGFAGAGVHLAKRTGEWVHGSPLKALEIQPPFKEYFFIDLERKKAAQLDVLVRRLHGDRPDVHIFDGDCNEVLLKDVFPRVRYKDYRRGLCVLDPYGLQLDWKVIETAGRMKSIEIFLNFPVHAMNRGALWHDPEKLPPGATLPMTRFWGDESWKSAAYGTEVTLFGPRPDKRSNEEVVEAFRKRLMDVAEFKFVARPMPMRNSVGAVVYYLLFAGPKETGEKIVTDIFAKYRDREGSH